jgi:hypothetical protein
MGFKINDPKIFHTVVQFLDSIGYAPRIHCNKGKVISTAYALVGKRYCISVKRCASFAKKTQSCSFDVEKADCFK